MVELGILTTAIAIGIVLNQIIVLPLHWLATFHLPNVLGVGNLHTWLGVGITLLVGAWLLGDR